MGTHDTMSKQHVQTFGKKRTATAVAFCKEGRGLIRVNGSPIGLVEPAIMRMKVYEPVLVLKPAAFSNVDIRVRVSGGGHTSQVYAIRQAIAKALELKKALISYDRTLLVADPRRREPKKFGGPGARARYQSRTDKGFRPLLSVLLLCSLLAYLPTIVTEPRGLHFLYALPCPIAFRPGSFRCLGSRGRRWPLHSRDDPSYTLLDFLSRSKM